MTKTRSLSAAVAAVFAFAPHCLQAQNGPLPAGTCLVATFGFGTSPVPADDSFQVVDSFARTATRFSVNGFPTRPDESPSTLLLESPWSFLLGSRVLPPSVVGGPITFGNVYRVQWTGSAWSATVLNQNPLNEGVAALATIGSTIYVKTNRFFSVGTVPGTSILALPLGGGVAVTVVDLSARGAPGVGGALTALGSVLHAFTFVSDVTSRSPAGEHWTIDVGRSPPIVSRIGSLPISIRQRPPSAPPRHIGVHTAVWDARMNAFAIVGTFGDVLWRSPGGTDVLLRAMPGAWGADTSFVHTLAIDTDTGAYMIGDKWAHVEELRCPHGDFYLDRTTLTSVPTGDVCGLAYVPGAPQYLPDVAMACADGAAWPCSYIDRRPAPGASVNFTLETSRVNTLLLIGRSNSSAGSLPLPFDLTVLGAPACWLGTSIDIAVPVTGPAPTLPVTLPQVMVPMFTQWAVLAPANPLGLVLSESRRL